MAILCGAIELRQFITRFIRNKNNLLHVRSSNQFKNKIETSPVQVIIPSWCVIRNSRKVLLVNFVHPHIGWYRFGSTLSFSAAIKRYAMVEFVQAPTQLSLNSWSVSSGLCTYGFQDKRKNSIFSCRAIDDGLRIARLPFSHISRRNWGNLSVSMHQNKCCQLTKCEHVCQTYSNAVASATKKTLRTAWVVCPPLINRHKIFYAMYQYNTNLYHYSVPEYIAWNCFFAFSWQVFKPVHLQISVEGENVIPILLYGKCLKQIKFANVSSTRANPLKVHFQSCANWRVLIG